MENSIEAIWKEGFLNEKSLVAPRINDLYHQKSMHLVDKMKRMFRNSLMIIVITAIIFPVIYYILDFLWQGVAASVLLLLTAWYNKRQLRGIKTLDQGATSLDYLKSFDIWLKDAFSRGKKIARFSYPLYLMISISTIWSAWNRHDELFLKTHQKYPDLVSAVNSPLIALIIAVAMALLMFFFSDKIYYWEVRLMYGRVLDKLEETITEMEKLKQE